jgi:CHAD domain-containing protein
MSIPGEDNNTCSDANSAPPLSEEKIGLAVWMDQVATELDRTREGFNPDAVHDLRVALRRCISISDIYLALDPIETWGEMRETGRRLFKNLGDLRDVHVMREWTEHLAGKQDPAGILLSAYLDGREAKLRERATVAVAAFNCKKWLKLRDRLTKRLLPLPAEDEVFQHFALELWHEARQLHRQALRNRSRASFHQLRIGLKHFRYTIESFLPQRHELWGKDLKMLQDVLGEYHDLFVLWKTALQIGALADRDLRSQWHERIEEESRIRLLAYRSKMIGKESLWPVWRSGLPQDNELKMAAEARIRIWASYRDPNFARTLHMAELALQLFDGLRHVSFIAQEGAEDIRSTLHSAAIMYNVGTSAGGKSNYKQIRRTKPPLGFPAQDYALAALATRYRRGLIRGSEDEHLGVLSAAQKQRLQLIAAILCLANSLAGKDDHGIQHLVVNRLTDALLIHASGYREQDPLARKLAAARHPLEVTCGAPILIRPLTEGSDSKISNGQVG